MKKLSSSFIIKIAIIAAVVAALVTLVIVFREDICKFIDKIKNELIPGGKNKFKEYFDFDDVAAE